MRPAFLESFFLEGGGGIEFESLVHGFSKLLREVPQNSIIKVVQVLAIFTKTRFSNVFPDGGT